MDELARLKLANPLWRIRIEWATRDSQPDAWILTATRGDVTVTAYTIPGAQEEITRAERGGAFSTQKKTRP